MRAAAICDLPLLLTHTNRTLGLAFISTSWRSSVEADRRVHRMADPKPALVRRLLANIMYALPAAQLSQRDRATGPVLLAEVVATAGLVALIFALARSGRGALSAAAGGPRLGGASRVP